MLSLSFPYVSYLSCGDIYQSFIVLLTRNFWPPVISLIQACSQKSDILYIVLLYLGFPSTGGWTRPVVGPSDVENGQYLIAPSSLNDAPGDKLFFINIILKKHDLSFYLVCSERIRF